MLDDYEGGFMVNSVKMGGALFITDLALRPRFSTNGMEIILFGIEGFILAMLYHGSQGSCTKYDVEESDEKIEVCDQPDTTIVDAFVCGLTVYFTDYMLAMLNSDDMIQLLFKYMLQGMIVTSILTYRLYKGLGSA